MVVKLSREMTAEKMAAAPRRSGIAITRAAKRGPCKTRIECYQRSRGMRARRLHSDEWRALRKQRDGTHRHATIAFERPVAREEQ
jgi:hypothetical protein